MLYVLLDAKERLSLSTSNPAGFPDRFASTYFPITTFPVQPVPPLYPRLFPPLARCMIYIITYGRKIKYYRDVKTVEFTVSDLSRSVRT
jgi:hypothetical protein